MSSSMIYVGSLHWRKRSWGMIHIILLMAILRTWQRNFSGFEESEEINFVQEKKGHVRPPWIIRAEACSGWLGIWAGGPLCQVGGQPAGTYFSSTLPGLGLAAWVLRAQWPFFPPGSLPEARAQSGAWSCCVWVAGLSCQDLHTFFLCDSLLCGSGLCPSQPEFWNGFSLGLQELHPPGAPPASAFPPLGAFLALPLCCLGMMGLTKCRANSVMPLLLLRQTDYTDLKWMWRVWHFYTPGKPPSQSR